MSIKETEMILEQSFKRLGQSPGTIAVLRKIRNRHGVDAALDALLLILIRYADRKNCAFSYADSLRQFCTRYPTAVSMLDHALSAYGRENAVMKPHLN